MNTDTLMTMTAPRYGEMNVPNSSEKLGWSYMAPQTCSAARHRGLPQSFY